MRVPVRLRVSVPGWGVHIPRAVSSSLARPCHNHALPCQDHALQHTRARSLLQSVTPPLTRVTGQVTKALIDMENMFELLATVPRVRDEPGAASLAVTQGAVEFKQV